MLSDYGLTTTQAIVYLATLRLGAALVSKISRVSGVRREDVYRMLEHLEEIGLVERMHTKPTKIRAMPLEQALSLLIERQKDTAKRKISELTDRKDDVLKHIRSQIAKLNVEEKRGTPFALLSNNGDVLSRVKGMIQIAETEIDVMTSANNFISFLSSFAESLDKSAHKRVMIRAMLEVGLRQSSAIRRIRAHAFPKGSIELRYSHEPLGHYLIVDFSQVLLATSPDPSQGQRPYLWTCDTEFSEILCRNFMETWHACGDKNLRVTVTKGAEMSTES